MDWKLYYADGSVVSSDDCSWDAAPSRGVLAVTSPQPETGQRTAHGRNFYVLWNGVSYGMDWPGLWDYLIEAGHPEAHKPLRDVDLDALAGPVKYGRYAPRAVFAQVLQQAQRDPDFPRRSARDRDDERTGEA
jgi:hypothetical protein